MEVFFKEEQLRYCMHNYFNPIVYFMISNKLFITLAAWKWIFLTMAHLVLCMIQLPFKTFMKLSTVLLFLPNMYYLLFKQTFLEIKTFLTKASQECTFPCVYSLVIYQSFLPGKAFVKVSISFWCLSSPQKSRLAFVGHSEETWF